MEPSEMFWSSVPDHYMRGEAQQDLASLVLQAANPGEDKGCNGLVCDALSFALNRVWKGKEEEFQLVLDELFEEYEDGDDDGKEE